MASSTLVPVDLGVSSDGAGGRAEGHAVDWRAARSHRGTSTEERDASGVMANWMAQTRQGGRRVRNGPRRACAGWAVKGHLGHSPSLDLWCMRRIECPKCPFGGGAFCGSWPVLHLAALRVAHLTLATNCDYAVRDFELLERSG